MCPPARGQAPLSQSQTPHYKARNTNKHMTASIQYAQHSSTRQHLQTSPVADRISKKGKHRFAVRMKCILWILLFTCVLCFIEAIKSAKSREDECQLGRDERKYLCKVKVTINGRICVPWNSVPNKRYVARHNYCRNSSRTQPWCFVRKGGLYVTENCDITQVARGPQTPEPSKQDTESTCGERRLDRLSKIIGGSRSTVESQPWIAAIFKGSGFMCGGTLIAPCWVLTAAHCFPAGMNTQIRRFLVYLGMNAINETNSVREQRFTVSKLVIHEDFDYKTENYNHDIALLKIADNNGRCAAKTKFVRTACLAPYQQMLPSGFYCNVAGYGVHQKGVFGFSKHLKEAQVKLISQKTCQDYYSKDEVSENMLCAAGRDWTEDACQGDSGGPLVCEVNDTMFLFGIISWGNKCAEESNPGVYTKVTNYNHWISRHTGLPSYTAGSRYPQKD